MKVFSISLFIIFIGGACDAMETTSTIVDKQYQPARSVEHPGYIARECSPDAGQLSCHNVYVWPEVDNYPARYSFILQNCVGERFRVFVKETDFYLFSPGDRYRYHTWYVPFCEPVRVEFVNNSL